MTIIIEMMPRLPSVRPILLLVCNNFPTRRMCPPVRPQPTSGSGQLVAALNFGSSGRKESISVPVIGWFHPSYTREDLLKSGFDVGSDLLQASQAPCHVSCKHSSRPWGVGFRDMSITQTPERIICICMKSRWARRRGRRGCRAAEHVVFVVGQWRGEIKHWGNRRRQHRHKG